MINKKHIALTIIGLTVSVFMFVIVYMYQRNAQQAAIQAESIQRLTEMRTLYRQNQYVKPNRKQEHDTTPHITEHATNVTDTHKSAQSETEQATPALVLPEKTTTQESPERRAQRLDLVRRMEENHAMLKSVADLQSDDVSRHRKLIQAFLKLKTTPEQRRIIYREMLKHYPENETDAFYQQVENAPDMTSEQIKIAERNNRIDRKTIYMMSKVLQEETRQLIRETKELYGIDPDNSTQH